MNESGLRWRKVNELFFRWQCWTIQRLKSVLKKSFPPRKGGWPTPPPSRSRPARRACTPACTSRAAAWRGMWELSQVFHSQLIIAACPITWMAWDWVPWGWEASTRWEPQCLTELRWVGRNRGERERLSRDNSLMFSRDSSRRQGRLWVQPDIFMRINHCFSPQVFWCL